MTLGTWWQYIPGEWNSNFAAGRTHHMLSPTNSQCTSPVSGYSAAGMLFHCSDLCSWQELLTISVLGTCPQARPLKAMVSGSLYPDVTWHCHWRQRSWSQLVTLIPCSSTRIIVAISRTQLGHNNWGKQKTCFLSFWSSCATWKINGQRSTGTTFFNIDVNLPLLEVCEAKANTLALSKVNSVIRVHNTQVTGFHCVWMLGYPQCLLLILIFFLNFLLQMGCFQVFCFWNCRWLVITCSRDNRSCKLTWLLPFYPSHMVLLLGYSKAFVIPFFILNCYPLEEIDEEYCKFIPRVTDQRAFQQSHPICASSAPLTFAVKCVFVPLWKPDKCISWIGKWWVMS